MKCYKSQRNIKPLCDWYLFCSKNIKLTWTSNLTKVIKTSYLNSSIWVPTIVPQTWNICVLCLILYHGTNWGRQVGPKSCHSCDRRHICDRSTPSVVPVFEIDDGSHSRSCMKKFLISCILALLVLILLVIILRSIF